MKKTLISLASCIAAICAFFLTSCEKRPDKDPVKYKIVITNDGNGSAASDLAEAGEGAAVTISATPGEGYVFAKWNVVSGGAGLSDVAANPAIFTMPAANVEIKAEFASKAEPETKYTITVINDGNGSAAADLAEAEKGTTVTITATPGEGYVFAKWSVVSGGARLSNEAANPATFIMPAANVEIKAEFKVFNGLDLIPDEAFRSFCATTFDKNPKDGILSQTEVLDVPSIDIPKLGIKSLEGIQLFANIMELKCSINEISSVDLSKNLALQRLTLTGSLITELNVSANVKLTSLVCDENKLTSIDVSNNTELVELSCASNAIAMINVSGCPKLTTLILSKNKMTSLPDLSNNPNLRQVDCNWMEIPDIDLSNMTALQQLNCLFTKVASLNISGCEALTRLILRGAALSADALRKVFNDLPMRNPASNASIMIQDNPGTSDLTAEDTQVATDKNWQIM